MRVRRLLFGAVAVAPIAAALAGGGCGGSLPVHDENGMTGSADAAGYDGGRLDGPLRLDAACAITLDSPPLTPAAHGPVGTVIDYPTNPPSSGAHYPYWAAFTAYDHPVPRPYYVHDLEHGAVVFLYKCDGACPDVVDTLRKAMAAIPDDADCTGSGVRVRALIVPDPELDVPVAAAAWGWIYRAECADLRTLTDFALNHYAQGPENVCGDGTDQL